MDTLLAGDLSQVLLDSISDTIDSRILGLGIVWPLSCDFSFYLLIASSLIAGHNLQADSAIG